MWESDLYFIFLFFFSDWDKTYKRIQANRAIITVRYITEVFCFFAITETIYSSIICKSADQMFYWLIFGRSYWLMSLIFVSMNLFRYYATSRTSFLIVYDNTQQLCYISFAKAVFNFACMQPSQKEVTFWSGSVRFT